MFIAQIAEEFDNFFEGGMLRFFSLSVLFSTSVFANTIKHPSCNLYLDSDSMGFNMFLEGDSHLLPKEMETIKKVLQKKGYIVNEKTPEQLIDHLKEGDLVARGPIIYGSVPYHCTVDFRIKRVGASVQRTLADTDLFEVHYSHEMQSAGPKEVQKNRCKKAFAKALRKAPKCKLSSN